MDINPVVNVIPLYIILIGIELLYSAIAKQKKYRLSDALTNISCGITQQITKLFLSLFSFLIYELVYARFALFNIPENWWSFVLLFILVDFCYYWSHRMSHEINLFWGGHVVHHQSEDYNLSVALRQSSTSVFFSFLFYLPLAVLGFPTKDYVFVIAINLIYQFWIHTEVIGKMGIFELVLNTPSHHRVHHGVNPKYIDKNHAGVFIIWDKLFGTFQREEETPTYGITSPIKSWNPVWANLNHYINMGKTIFKIKGFGDKVKFLFYKPGWLPSYMGGFQSAPEVNASENMKYEVSVSKNGNYYVLTQYIVALLITAIFLFTQSKPFYTITYKLLFSGYIIGSITICGGLLELKNWARILEVIRYISLLGLLVVLYLQFAVPDIYLIAILVYTIFSSIWFLSLRFYRKD